MSIRLAYDEVSMWMCLYSLAGSIWFLLEIMPQEEVCVCIQRSEVSWEEIWSQQACGAANQQGSASCLSKSASFCSKKTQITTRACGKHAHRLRYLILGSFSYRWPPERSPFKARIAGWHYASGHWIDSVCVRNMSQSTKKNSETSLTSANIKKKNHCSHTAAFPFNPWESAPPAVTKKECKDMTFVSISKFIADMHVEIWWSRKICFLYKRVFFNLYNYAVVCI